MKIVSFSRVRNKIRICNDILIIFIFESQAGVWSSVELRHEHGPLYRFHIHYLQAIGFLEIPYSIIYRLVLYMKIVIFSRVHNEIRICNDVLIIFIFESHAGFWSRVELRHEFEPLYIFHIHNL
jgi:hypothetical protein